jgi:hypothetical protein
MCTPPRPKSQSRTLATDADVAALAKEIKAGLKSLPGTLAIKAGVTSLKALRGLTEAGGLLVEGATLTSLLGLETLRTVSGDIVIRYCGQLASLDGLSSLQHVEGMLNLGQPNWREAHKRAEGKKVSGVETLAPFANESLRHITLPSLEAAGSIRLESPFVETFRLPRLARISGTVTNPHDQPGLSVSGESLLLLNLELLETAYAVRIRDCERLPALRLPRLATVGDLDILNTKRLSELSLPSLRQSASIDITLRSA